MCAKRPLLCLMWVAVLVFTESRTRVQKSGRSHKWTTNVRDRTVYWRTQHMRSKIQCAAACELQGGCQKYSYDDNVCRMGKSADGSGVMYKSYDKCPADKDYHVFAFNDMQLCLKYYPSKVNHVGANATCAENEAHLVLLESQAARMRINEILTGLGVTDPVWLDGFDESTTNLFLSWTGKPLAWIEWSDGDPNDRRGEDCLVGTPKDGYKHSDAHCFEADFTTLCQIDIM